MGKRIHDKKLNGLAHVGLYGCFGRPWDDVRKTEQFARNLTWDKSRPNHTVFVRPPVTGDDPGWWSVRHQQEGIEYLECEGVLLTKPHSVAVIPSRDCAVLVLANKLNGRVGATHAGRRSLLSNIACDACTVGVVSNLLSAVAPVGSDRSQVYAYITAYITPEHFSHNDHSFVEPFIARFGEQVVPDREHHTLDLAKVIELQLTSRKVLPENICRYGKCSYEHPNMGSRRAGKDGENVVIVANH